MEIIRKIIKKNQRAKSLKTVRIITTNAVNNQNQHHNQTKHITSGQNIMTKQFHQTTTIIKTNHYQVKNNTNHHQIQ